MKYFQIIRQSIVMHKFASYLTAAFLLVALFAVRSHELWRDEVQAWLLARNSSTPWELLYNMRYEGHPPLWHFLLYVASHLVSNIIAMQILHIVIGATIVYLVARYAPFSRLQKVLFSFSYLTLFEYTVIARNYSLGVLLLVIFCVLYTREKKHYVAIGVTLFLLTQANVMGALLAPWLGMLTGLNFLQATPRKQRSYRKISIAALLTLLGLICFYFETRVPKDGAYVPYRIGDARYILAAVWASFVPIPNRVINFWNTNIVYEIDRIVAFSVAMLIFMAVFLSRSAKIFWVFVSGTTTMLLFFYFKTPGALRHQGFLFIFYLVCMWLYEDEYHKGKVIKDWTYTAQRVLLTVVLFAQVYAAIIAVHKDHKLDFSESKNAAAYIQSNHLENQPIIGDIDFATSPILGYLDKPAYYAQSDQWGTYVSWNKRRKPPLEAASIDDARRIARQRHTNALLITIQPLHGKNAKQKDVKLVKSLAGPSVIPDESYYIYKVSP